MIIQGFLLTSISSWWDYISCSEKTFLKDTDINLNNILIMTGNFNIRDNDWNLSYLYHLIYVDILREIADSFNLELLLSMNQVPI